MPISEAYLIRQPQSHRSLQALEGLHYIPNYLNESQHDRLLKDVHSSKSKWTQVSGRRLQSYGGTVHEKWGGLLQAPIPAWLQTTLSKIDQDFHLYDGAANHVLLNAYEPGQGILAHEDGPVYYPAACILSLGSSAVMHFRRKSHDGIESKPVASVLLMPGSLLVFNGEAYKDCLHGIDEVFEDVLDDSILNLEQCNQKVGAVLPRTVRHSLTIRRVPKVKRLFKLPGQRT
ncbi:hypothetical protein WJX79_009076 [Trebouxia sp. C0005]